MLHLPINSYFPSSTSSSSILPLYTVSLVHSFSFLLLLLLFSSQSLISQHTISYTASSSCLCFVSALSLSCVYFIPSFSVLLSCYSMLLTLHLLQYPFPCPSLSLASFLFATTGLTFLTFSFLLSRLWSYLFYSDCGHLSPTASFISAVPSPFSCALTPIFPQFFVLLLFRVYYSVNAADFSYSLFLMLTFCSFRLFLLLFSSWFYPPLPSSVCIIILHAATNSSHSS